MSSFFSFVCKYEHEIGTATSLLFVQTWHYKV